MSDPSSLATKKLSKNGTSLSTSNITKGIMIEKKLITLAGKTMLIIGKWKMNWSALINETMWIRELAKTVRSST